MTSIMYSVAPTSARNGYVLSWRLPSSATAPSSSYPTLRLNLPLSGILSTPPFPRGLRWYGIAHEPRCLSSSDTKYTAHVTSISSSSRCAITGTNWMSAELRIFIPSSSTGTM